MLTGRFIRGDFFNFAPMHKLLISGSHKPPYAASTRRCGAAFAGAVHGANTAGGARFDFAHNLEPEWPAILRWMTDESGRAVLGKGGVMPRDSPFSIELTRRERLS
jgi:hypothetical protein